MVLRLFLSLLSLLVSTSFCAASRIGEWRTHNAWSVPVLVEEGKDRIYAVSEGSLYGVDKQDLSVIPYSRVTGLSDQGISHIHYSHETATLVVLYQNLNIDFVRKDAIFNLPDIANKALTGDKTLYQVREQEGVLYLSTGFGLVLVDLKKQEVSDTYRTSVPLKGACIHNDSLYVLTDAGIRRGALNRNLSDPANWSDFDSFRACDLLSFDGLLMAIAPGDALYYYDRGSWIRWIPNNAVRRMKIASNGDVVVFGTTWNGIYRLRNRNSYETYWLPSEPNDVSVNEDLFWIADPVRLLSCFSGKSELLQPVEEGFIPEGPRISPAFDLALSGDRVVVSGGGKWSNRYYRKGAVGILQDQSWETIDPEHTASVAGQPFSDIIRTASDPKEPDHLYAFSWGEGIFEFRDGVFVRLMNSTNTPLQTIFESDMAYHRVDGAAFDTQQNLWITNSMVSHPLKVLRADGSWVSLAYDDLLEHNSMGRILITSSGQKWIPVLFSGNKQPGIFVLDDNNTLADQRDDKTRYISSIVYNDNGVANIVTPDRFLALAEDRKGNVWIGTSKGPFVIPSTSAVFSDNPTFSRIKIPRNDGSGYADYLLAEENITAIAIDGANRKWFGTENNGLYLVSEDGMTMLHHFTKEDTPLPENHITSLLIHPVSGELFIGTESGLVSYQPDAAEGKTSYEQVYAYPNPVRPDYNGVVTVTGLMENSLVKITDASNNLLYQGRSNGGIFTWDARTKGGDRVATGVYLVYATSSDGKKGVVTKILVVR